MSSDGSDLRFRYAEAIRRVDAEVAASRHAVYLTDDVILDALVAVRDAGLESLRERAERAERICQADEAGIAHLERRIARAEKRAETAEASVARARQVCHKAMAEPDAPGQWLVAQQVLAAIDATEETNARR